MEGAVLQTDVDRYVIAEYLAEGGMGAVFLGKKVGIGGFEKQVVLKQLLPEFISQPAFIDLFLREARISASLDHANIVHTIDLVAAGNDYFIVMEYVRGADLRAILRRIKIRRKQLSPAVGVYVIREILNALDYAYNKVGVDDQPLRLIHRDISPSNIMVSAAGEVKLTDFGIAKASTHKTLFYRVKGKVGYMSPEQASGAGLVDHRSDLYALGICLYELISGQRLFVADLTTPVEEIFAQPLRLLEGDAAMPRGIDALLAKSLARDAEDRFQSAASFQAALAQLALANHIILTAPDLAQYLRETCGPDPRRWSEAQVEITNGAGTEVLSSPLTQMSGIEVSSVLRRPDWSTDISTEEEIRPVQDHRTEDLQSQSTAHGQGAEQTAVDEQTVSASGNPWPEEERTSSNEPTLAYHERRSQTEVSPTDMQEDSLFMSAPTRTELSVSITIDAESGEIVEAQTGEGPDQRYRLSDDARPSATDSFQPDDIVRPVQAEMKASEDHAESTLNRKRVKLMTIAGTCVLVVVAAVVAVVIAYSGGDLPSLTGPGEGTIASDLQIDSPGVATRDATAVSTKTLDGPDAGRDQRAPAQGQGVREIQLWSTPPGALVFIGEAKRCRTPCTVTGLRDDLNQVLSLRKRRFRPWARFIGRGTGTPTELRVNLTKMPNPAEVGYLMINAVPPAEVIVDDQPQNWLTSEGRLPLAPGKHIVVLSHPAYNKRLSFTVVIYRQQVSVVDRMTL
jgi:serine/threonine protein kinase